MMKRIFTILLLTTVVLWAVKAFAEDWDEPLLTSNYSDVLSILKERDTSVAKMDYSGASDIPIGVIRWNDASERFEKYNGTIWENLWGEATEHLIDTSNPHNVTASQTGAATTATVSAHTGSSSNPHNVTASQTGAMKGSNNLSEITSPASARASIGVPSLTAYNSHVGNSSNPHGVSTGQIGALKASNNLSEITSDSTARNNIGAAASGTNSDINTLLGLNSVQSTGALTIQSNTIGADVIIKPSGATKTFRFDDSGKFIPHVRPNYTPWGSYTTLRSINPAAATAADCANVLNTMMKDLIDMGPFQ